MKNARGAVMRNDLVVTLNDDEIKELDHIDAIVLTEVNGGGEENMDLIEHEQGSWECPKCNTSNLNEAGFCANTVDGKRCGAAPACVTKLSWEGCFVSEASQLSLLFHFSPTFELTCSSLVQPKWKCDKCTTPNPLDEDVCMACKSARDIQ